MENHRQPGAVTFTKYDQDIKNISEYSSDNGETWYSVEDYADHLPDNWVRDGLYYYYTEPLQPGELTNPLITNVKTTFASAEDVKQYEIIVYQESVQTLDKNGEEFTGNDAYNQAWDEFLDNIEIEEPSGTGTEPTPTPEPEPTTEPEP